MQAGKTIGAKRERMAPDSERERARRTIRKRKVISIIAAILLGGLMVYLGVRAVSEWIKWLSNREEVIIIEKEPSVEIISDKTGRLAEEGEVSSRVKEYVANLEEEFVLVERKVKKVHLPVDKIRELDVELEGVSGLIKISIDRNPAVSAEDANRMLKYLEGQGIEAFEYIDVRVERKGYWK